MEIFIGGVEIRDHWDYFLFIWSFFLVFQISVMTQNKEFSFPEWREVGSTNEWRRTYFCLRASLSNICILKLFLCRPRLDTTKHYQWRLNIKIKHESFISDMLPSLSLHLLHFSNFQCSMFVLGKIFGLISDFNIHDIALT